MECRTDSDYISTIFFCSCFVVKFVLYCKIEDIGAVFGVNYLVRK